MNRRDFLGILGKGAIALTIPLSASGLLEASEKSIIFNSLVTVKARYEDFGYMIGICISYKKNGKLYRNKLMMDISEEYPTKYLASVFNGWLGFKGVSEHQIDEAIRNIEWV